MVESWVLRGRTTGTILYARDSTILTMLIDHCTRGSIPYSRDSTILTVLIDNCTRGSTSLHC
jgi:hypothetical protein